MRKNLFNINNLAISISCLFALFFTYSSSLGVGYYLGDIILIQNAEAGKGDRPSWLADMDGNIGLSYEPGNANAQWRITRGEANEGTINADEIFSTRLPALQNVGSGRRLYDALWAIVDVSGPNKNDGAVLDSIARNLKSGKDLYVETGRITNKSIPNDNLGTNFELLNTVGKFLRVDKEWRMMLGSDMEILRSNGLDYGRWKFKLVKSPTGELKAAAAKASADKAMSQAAAILNNITTEIQALSNIPLEYNKIVRIFSPKFGTIWTHPSNRSKCNESNTPNTIDLLKDTSPYAFELMVAGGVTDKRQINGCDFFLLQAKGSPEKNGAVKFGDEVEIYSLSTQGAIWNVDANKLWPLNRKWSVNYDSRFDDASTKSDPLYETLVWDISNPNTKNGHQLFSLISPTGKTGVIKQNDDIRIICKAPDAPIKNKVLWISESNRWGNHFSEVLIGDRAANGTSRTDPNSFLKIYIPDFANLIPEAKAVYDRLIADPIFSEKTTRIEFNPPSDFMAEPGNFKNITVGSKNGVVEAWALDENGTPYRYDPFAGSTASKEVPSSGFTDMPSKSDKKAQNWVRDLDKVNPWIKKDLNPEVTSLLDIAVSSYGDMVAINNDKTAVKYDWTKKIWMKLPASNEATIKLNNITVADNSNIYATSEASSDIKSTIYKYVLDSKTKNPSWQKISIGTSIAAGLSTSKKLILIGVSNNGKAYEFINNVWTPLIGVANDIIEVTIGNENNIFGLNKDGYLYKLNYKTKKWESEPGKNGKQSSGFISIAANVAGTIFALDGDGVPHHKGDAGIKDPSAPDVKTPQTRSQATEAGITKPPVTPSGKKTGKKPGKKIKPLKKDNATTNKQPNAKAATDKAAADAAAAAKAA